MEREAERHFNGGLTLKDDTIRDRCQEIARLLTTSIGSLMCDGDTSKSLERHSSLVDALVDHTKEFLSEHKEYDSFSGLTQITQNPEYMAQMAIVISEVYDCLTDDERQQLAIDTLTHTEE